MLFMNNCNSIYDKASKCEVHLYSCFIAPLSGDSFVAVFSQRSTSLDC